MRNTVIALVIAAGAGLGLTGCGKYVSPCTTLAAPTQQELSAVAAGAGVEREVEDRYGNEVECELVGNTWQEEQESD